MLFTASFVVATYAEINLFFLFPDSTFSVLDIAILDSCVLMKPVSVSGLRFVSAIGFPSDTALIKSSRLEHQVPFLSALPSCEQTSLSATGHPPRKHIICLVLVKSHWLEDNNGIFSTEWKIITSFKKSFRKEMIESQNNEQNLGYSLDLLSLKMLAMHK